MDSKRLAKQGKELVGMLLIGRGVIDVSAPVQHLQLWKGLSQTTDRWIDAFSERPYLVQLVGCLRISLGLALASHQRADEAQELQATSTAKPIPVQDDLAESLSY